MTPPADDDDLIHIQELELSARIGVPDDERAQPQRLNVSVTLWPVTAFGQLNDQIEKAVNYAAVCREVKEVVAARNDKLIETMAEALAQHLLRTFAIRRVRLELRKFILPEVNYVAAIVTRDESAPA